MVSGVSQQRRPKGWVLQPQAPTWAPTSIYGDTSWTMVPIYLPAAPWSLELSPEHDGTLQKRPSFHQPSYAHPMRSSQKTPRQAPGNRGRAPTSASANHDSALMNCHLAREPKAMPVSFHVPDLFLFSPTPCKGFAGAILSLHGLHPQRRPSLPQVVWSCPFSTVAEYWRHFLPSQCVILGQAGCSHFLEKLQGPLLGKIPRPLIVGRIRQKHQELGP